MVKKLGKFVYGSLAGFVLSFEFQLHHFVNHCVNSQRVASHHMGLPTLLC